MFIPRISVRMALYPLVYQSWPVRLMLIGTGIFILGLIFFLSAQPTQPVMIKGTLDTYYKYSNSQTGNYTYSGIKLKEDDREFSFNIYGLSPQFPETLPPDQAIQLWYDKGSSNLVAISLTASAQQTTPQYSTIDWRDRTYRARDQHFFATIIMLIALVIGGTGFILFKFPPKKKGQQIHKSS